MLEFNREDKTAVLVVDMQNDFVLVNGAIPADGAGEIMDNLTELLEMARKNNIQVIYTSHVHRGDYSDFGIAHYFEPISCIEGSRGSEICDPIKPKEGDFVVTKRRYDAFIGTELDLYLRNHGIKNIIFAGVLTDACVFATLHHARCLDYKICIVSDCCAGSTKAKHEAALDIMRQYCARVANLKKTIDIFGLK